MSTGHFLLGVLAEGPAHGYDLKREHDRRLPTAKPLAYGQVYATLSRLERDGLVEVAETRQEAGPERTTYALTDAGDRALRDWLGEPEPAGPYPAEDLVRKTVIALHLDADAAAFLQAQRTIHLSRMRELVSQRRAMGDVDARIEVDHTIYHLDADLKWLESAAEHIDEERNRRS